MSYALDPRFEVFHTDGCTIFNAKRDRCTSENVRDELRAKEADRMKLYVDILNHLDAGKPSSQFPFPTYKNSDQNAAINIFDLISQNKLSLDYLRMLGAELKQGIHEGLGRTVKPYIKPSKDRQMIADLGNKAGMHPPDREILADFFDWAHPKSTGSIFVTGDGDIRKSRGLVFKCVNALEGGCGHLGLQFIVEAAKNIGRP